MATFDVTAFRSCYRAFLQPGRILLSGHSHQAWPDTLREAQGHYFDDSARYVDEKWEKAVFPKMEAVARRILPRMGFAPTDSLAFGKSTHELVYRLLSSFPVGKQTRVVTTTSEFHSLHRQLNRLAEAGVDVTFVDAQPRETLADRLMEELREGVTLLAVSVVLFEDSYVLPRVPELLARAHSLGIHVLLDAYHAFNVMPLEWGKDAHHAFVTAGGYKYAQFGEGLCWLRVPAGNTLRPVYTGWFADFPSLSRPRSRDVGYGDGGARFLGATFDGSSVYRAEAALDHFDHFGLGVAELRAISLRQTARLMDRLQSTGVLGKHALRTPREDARRGGFVSVEVPRAERVVQALRERGVHTDSRGDLLRLGPAPYVTDEELDAGVDALAAVLANPRVTGP
jgi:selenocysteine lyase/cysteine desulfurase